MIYRIPEDGPFLANRDKKKSIQELGQRYEPDDSQFHVSTVTDMDEFQQAEEALLDPVKQTLMVCVEKIVFLSKDILI